DLFTLLLGLPLAPVRGLVGIAEVLRDQVERELYDPNVARRQLEDVAEQRAAGDISADEEAEQQQQILDRVIGQPGGEARDEGAEQRTGPTDAHPQERGTGG
ncbi:MAG TPA: gas vesicle protein GvpG, partial [Micromonosporaceae bacterium]